MKHIKDHINDNLNKENRMILTINGGSSSIKFSLYSIKEPLYQLFKGAIENIGSKNVKLNFLNSSDQQNDSLDFEANDHNDAANQLIEWLEKTQDFTSVAAIGHRIVHGMKQPKLN